MNGKSAMTKSNTGNIKWDSKSEFPITCIKCLGDNPYVKMMKADYDKECKICFRPFTVFRWKSDSTGKIMRTEICQTCSRVKHVCQSCILDLKFGMEMDTRDKFLKQKIEIPKDPTNRDFWAYKISRSINQLDLPYDDLSNYKLPLNDENINTDSNEKQENTEEIITKAEANDIKLSLKRRNGNDNCASGIRFYEQDDRTYISHRPINNESKVDDKKQKKAGAFKHKKQEEGKDQLEVVPVVFSKLYKIIYQFVGAEDFDKTYRSILKTDRLLANKK